MLPYWELMLMCLVQVLLVVPAAADDHLHLFAVTALAGGSSAQY